MKLLIFALIGAFAFTGCGKKKEVEAQLKYTEALVAGSGETCPYFGGKYTCEDLDTKEKSDLELRYYKYNDGSRTMEINGDEFDLDGKIHEHSYSDSKYPVKYAVDCSANSLEITEAFYTGDSVRISLFRDIAFPLVITHERTDASGKVKDKVEQRLGCKLK